MKWEWEVEKKRKRVSYREESIHLSSLESKKMGVIVNRKPLNKQIYTCSRQGIYGCNGREGEKETNIKEWKEG